MKQGRPVTVEVRNRTADPEIVHWHGLFLPPDTDGAMEEGSPMIAPGASTRLTFTPDPAGFRWFHTHTFAGKDLRKAQYGGLHGFLMIDASDNPGRYDREVFLVLKEFNPSLSQTGDMDMDCGGQSDRWTGRECSGWCGWARRWADRFLWRLRSLRR